jgi:hypothetical protein
MSARQFTARADDRWVRVPVSRAVAGMATWLPELVEVHAIVALSEQLGRPLDDREVRVCWFAERRETGGTVMWRDVDMAPGGLGPMPTWSTAWTPGEPIPDTAVRVSALVWLPIEAAESNDSTTEV